MPVTSPSPIGDLSADRGAYVISVDVASSLELHAHTLAPGRYAYCGSAYGPDGIRARVARHLRRDKPIRWHVDRLTAVGRVIDALEVPGGSECGLLRRLLALPGVFVPVPGFGSSDCRRCPAHLVGIPIDFDVHSLAARP